MRRLHEESRPKWYEVAVLVLVLVLSMVVIKGWFKGCKYTAFMQALGQLDNLTLATSKGLQIARNN